MLCSNDYTWLFARNGDVPSNAIEGGRSVTDGVQYIGRVFYGGSLVPGKVRGFEIKLHSEMTCPINSVQVPPFLSMHSLHLGNVAQFSSFYHDKGLYLIPI